MAGKNDQYPHLFLPLPISGKAKVVKSKNGKPRFPQFPREKENKANRVAHGQHLLSVSKNIAKFWSDWKEERAKKGLPVSPDIFLLLEVEPNIDLDFLRSSFQFEVVCEYDDGFLIVASEDVNLNLFAKKVTAFVRSERGGGSAAKVYNLQEDPDWKKRLARILSERVP